jgi:hypothetical protein
MQDKERNDGGGPDVDAQERSAMPPLYLFEDERHRQGRRRVDLRGESQIELLALVASKGWESGLIAV